MSDGGGVVRVARDVLGDLARSQLGEQHLGVHQVSLRQQRALGEMSYALLPGGRSGGETRLPPSIGGKGM